MEEDMKTETIRCHDLMVGDWCCDLYGLFPMQITNVGEDYAYATFEGNEGDPWEYNDKDDHPKPIEITRKLLEANGWRAESFMASPWNGFVLTYYFVKDEGDIHLEFKCDTLTIWFNYEKGNEGSNADISIPIKYVHQLQQALRIVGLNEMANNFKI